MLSVRNLLDIQLVEELPGEQVAVPEPVVGGGGLGVSPALQDKPETGRDLIA